MIDLHCHILPGIDDGASDWDTAVEMARIAAADGIHTIVATPHHKSIAHNDIATIERLTGELNERLQAENIDIDILPGAETHYYAEFAEDLKNGDILPLNHSRYVYLELPHQQVPRYIDEMVFEIVVQGYTPIIPHPERNREIRENPDLLYSLVDAGAISQVTAGSITGYYGSEVEKFSLQLFKHHLSHVIASDAHGVNRRKPVLSEAYDRLRKTLGRECEDSCLTNAEGIVNHEAIQLPTPSKIRRKKLFGWI